MMTKTLSTEDWNEIKSSFTKMKEKFPNLPDFDHNPTYRLTSIKGIEEQIQERSMGELIFYMDYLSSQDKPLIGKCEIIENG